MLNDTKTLLLLFSILTIGCVGAIGQMSNANPWLLKVDSTKDDLSYYRYISCLDTTRGAIELDENGNIVGIEPTFADRYFKNREVDTSSNILVAKAQTARDIAKCLISDKYGFSKLKQIDSFGIILVDDKFWCIMFSLNEEAFGGTNVILISKYNGQVLEWSNLK